MGTKKEKFNKDHGFTLIELMVVVVIIALLTTAALPQYARVIEKVRNVEVLHYLSSLKPFQEMFALQHGYYTADFNRLSFQPPRLRSFRPYVTRADRGGYRLAFQRTGIIPTGISRGYVITHDYDTERGIDEVGGNLPDYLQNW